MRALLLLFILLLTGSAVAQKGPGSSAKPKNLASPVRESSVHARTGEEIARIEEAVRSAATPKAASEVIPRDLQQSASLRDEVAKMDRGQEKARQEALNILGALRQAAEAAPDSSALAKVQEIKKRAEYRTAQPGTASNWLGRTLEGLGRWFRDTMSKINGPKGNINGPDMPDFSLPGWLIYIVWALIAGVILLAAWPLVRLVRFRVALKQRKAKGILEEEPERTRSEYLTLAEQLAGKGDFRGAIRMSYLAALKRFDEERVARFDRGETNWEHLARIRSSPTLPLGLDFRPATAAFDHYWYGKRPAHREDYERFVGWYDEVDVALRRAVAA